MASFKFHDQKAPKTRLFTCPGSGTFAQLAKASFMPPVDIASLPASLLDRFAGTAAERLIALLRLLTPLTAGTATMRVF
jgi:hypothetical protein